MKITNSNYCATVVQIEKIIELENCDNVYAAIINGQSNVIIPKSIVVKDIGLFFPVETQLSKRIFKYK